MLLIHCFLLRVRNVNLLCHTAISKDPVPNQSPSLYSCTRKRSKAACRVLVDNFGFRGGTQLCISSYISPPYPIHLKILLTEFSRPFETLVREVRKCFEIRTRHASSFSAKLGDGFCFALISYHFSKFSKTHHAKKSIIPLDQPGL